MSDGSLHYFIGGIGGSGMLPLAIILKGLGHTVSGSDRSLDQGRTPEKFQWLAAQGITLHPQDGSGIAADVSALVISKAVEETNPDIAAAKARNVSILKRVDLLIDLFNHAGTRIAVSGTSGKTTTTGMIGFLLKEAGMDPTVMNGGVFRNYARGNPYATAFVGKGDVFVTEVDESDGIEAVTRFTPDIAVLHNITLDHQPMEDLRLMFAGFLTKTKIAILNAADDNVIKLARAFKGRIITYGKDNADLCVRDLIQHPDGIEAIVQSAGKEIPLSLKLPGRHNVSNALAALAVGQAVGLPLEQAAKILSGFEGIRRRMEVIGTKNKITVMDDFAHNPDKIAATMETLREFPGRLHIFFQPHGYGFLKMLGTDVAETFARYLAPDDVLYMVEPFYLGGTVDRSISSRSVVDAIKSHGKNARLMQGREESLAAILQTVRPNDRVVIMGARDDTLTDFAREVLSSLS